MKNATHGYAHTDHCAGTNTFILRMSPSCKTPQGAIHIHTYIYTYSFLVSCLTYSPWFSSWILRHPPLYGRSYFEYIFWSKSGRFIFLTIYHKTWTLRSRIIFVVKKYQDSFMLNPHLIVWCMSYLVVLHARHCAWQQGCSSTWREHGSTSRGS